MTLGLVVFVFVFVPFSLFASWVFFAKSLCPSSGAAGTGAPFKFIQFTFQPSQDPSLPSEGLECNVSLFYLLDSVEPCDGSTIFSFCGCPQGFVLFSADLGPLDFDYLAKYSKNEIFQDDTNPKFETCFVIFGVFSLQVSAETAVESGANTFPKFTSKHEYILTDTKHGNILTNISSKSSMNMYSQIYTKSRPNVNQAYLYIENFTESFVYRHVFIVTICQTLLLLFFFCGKSISV